MNRLNSELERLYLCPAPTALDAASQTAGVRALVLELARPADWDVLARVWQGVQADLELPAPAIAVTGVDGYQLWFSLAATVPETEALDFLEALRERYLSDIAPDRLRLLPAGGTPTSEGAPQATLVPARQAPDGRWSAFVSSDLARIFAEEPWLDLPPNPDAQAELLSRLGSTTLPSLRQAMQRLRPSGRRSPDSGARPAAPPLAPTAHDPVQAPRAFLLGVMNDPTMEMPWRIEAAKALLAHADGHSRG